MTNIEQKEQDNIYNYLTVKSHESDTKTETRKHTSKSKLKRIMKINQIMGIYRVYAILITVIIYSQLKNKK